ncbi:MAG TPA: DUF3362 domain-containing protein [Gemmataceae bacterium]
MYYTGIDPFTKQPVKVARGLRDRKMQRALMQSFKPENWFTVRGALIQAGRQDLIGSGCDCLIPASGVCRTRATGRGGSRPSGGRGTMGAQARDLSRGSPWQIAQAPPDAHAVRRMPVTGW